MDEKIQSLEESRNKMMVPDENPIQILLADDDEDDRFLFESLLTNLRIQVSLIAVEDGEKLMKMLSTISMPPPPHLIFLDLNLPRMNGIECLAEIRGNKKFDSVPVFMFSTSDYQRDIDKAYEMGANLYIPKSLFFVEDKDSIEKLFSVPRRSFLSKISKEKFVLTKHTDLGQFSIGLTGI
jgi:CheY-like chemotaxis protein